MLAEYFFDKLAFFGFKNGCVQVPRQLLYIPFFTLGGSHFENIILDGIWQGIFLFNTLQSSPKHYCKGQVRVAGRIRCPELDAGGSFLAGFVHGHADHGRPVAICP